TALLLAFALYRLAQSPRTPASCGGAAAVLLLLARFVAITAYSFLIWQQCQGRYFMNLFCLVAAKALLYVLHERRLAVFLAGRSAAGTGARARTAIRAAILFMLTAYAASAIAQVVISCVTCFNTSSGGMTVTAQEATNVKYAVYGLEVALGVSLLAGNAYALSGIMHANAAAVVLGSDAVRFVAVLPVEVYKLVYSYDPASYSGFFPYGPGNGNSGIHSILDAYKVTVLLLMLYFPAAYVKMASRPPSSPGEKATSAPLRAASHPMQSTVTSATVGSIIEV
ncbi:hypothetical protein HK405_015062, partial [Cladochytrium tenue]